MEDVIEPPIFRNILLCYDDRPSARPENVKVLKRKLMKAGFNVSEYPGTPFEEDASFKLYGIDQETLEKIHNCIAMVVCCSQELKHNLCCKTVTRYARSRRENTPKGMPEILFTMMQGSYTTQSHPHSIDGWLKWFVKDTLWYPMWNRPYIRGAAEAIPQAILLKRRQISIDFGTDLKQQSTSQKLRSPSRSSRSPTRGSTRGKGWSSSRLSSSPSRYEDGLGATEPSPGIRNKYADEDYETDDFKDEPKEAASSVEPSEDKDTDAIYDEFAESKETQNLSGKMGDVTINDEK